jgi:hypothetical protein
MADDPIKPVIDALGVLATPDPPKVNPSAPQAPSIWAGPATGTQPLLGLTGTLMQMLYGASSDMHTVGTDISKALDKVVQVVNTIVDAIRAAVAAGTDVAAGVQQALAQMSLPATGTPGPDFASALYSQITDLLAAANSPKVALAELAQLGQLLTLLKTTFEPTP